MAQTKRKRRSKHRGNAAGTVEVRGRTGRPPSPSERKKQDKDQARQQRLNKPPTWRGAFNKAALISAFMFVLLLVLGHGKVIASVVFVLIAMALYVPLGYYLDSWMWRRRIAKEGGPR
jgi:Flp pilus assembly protein TadB